MRYILRFRNESKSLRETLAFKAAAIDAAGGRVWRDCPQWRQFLRDVFKKDEEVIDFIQRALGYTLTGLVSEELMFLIYGHESNGKSVLANVVAEVMGDYTQMAPSDLLTLRTESETPRIDVARMADRFSDIPCPRSAPGTRLVRTYWARHSNIRHHASKESTRYRNLLTAGHFRPLPCISTDCVNRLTQPQKYPVILMMGAWEAAEMVRLYAHLAPAHLAKHAEVVAGRLSDTSALQPEKEKRVSRS